MIGDNLHSGHQQIWNTQSIDSKGVTFEPITFGNHCTIGQRSVVSAGVTFGNDVTVTSEGSLPQNFRVENGGTVMGNPPNIFYSTTDVMRPVRELQLLIHTESQRQRDSDIESGTRNEGANGVRGDDEEGNVMLFNFVAVLINLLKLPSVVAIFIACHYLFTWLLKPVMNIGVRVAVSLLSYTLGLFIMMLFVVVLTRGGATSMKIGKFNGTIVYVLYYIIVSYIKIIK